MNIMKTLTIFAILLSGSILTYAACPANNAASTAYSSLQQEYMCKRIVSIANSGAAQVIDFQQVQMAFHDMHGYAQKLLSPPSPHPGSSNNIYIVFNNGTWMLFGIAGSDPHPLEAWGRYREFLIKNPSFMRF